MKDKKNENKICFILYTITTILFTLTGVSNILEKGITHWTGITNIALGVTFGAIAFLYFKRYNEEK